MEELRRSHLCGIAVCLINFNNLSKSIFTKMDCDSYSYLISAMQKNTHLVKTQLFRLQFGTMCRDGLILELLLKQVLKLG